MNKRSPKDKPNPLEDALSRLSREQQTKGPRHPKRGPRLVARLSDGTKGKGGGRPSAKDAAFARTLADSANFLPKAWAKYHERAATKPR